MKKLFFITMTLFFLGRGFASYNNEAVLLYNKANESLSNKNIDEAIDLLKKALSLEKNLFEAHYLLGNIFYTQNNFPKAIENYKKAIAISPKHTNSNRYLGNLLLSRSEIKSAIPLLKTAWENSNNIDVVSEYCTALYYDKQYDLAKQLLLKHHVVNNFGINYILYEIFTNENNFDNAIKYLEYAHKVNPKPEISKKLASLYIEQKNFNKSLNILLKIENKNIIDIEQIITLYIITNKPSSARSFFNKNKNLILDIDYTNKLSGDIYLAEKNVKSALDTYLQITNKEKFTDLNLKIATIYFDNKNFESAAQYFKMALSQNSNTIISRKKLAQIFLTLEKFDEALKYLAPLLNASTRDVQVLNLAGIINYKLKKYNLAKFYLNRSIEIDLNQPQSLFYLGLINYDTNQYPLAIVSFEESIKLDPNNISTSLYLGNSYYFVKKYDLALKNLTNVLAREKNNTIALRNLGYVYINLDNQKKALETFLHYLSIEPDDADILFAAGKLFTEENEFEKAQTYLNQAILISKSNQNYIYQLALVYIKKRDLDKAEAVLKSILEKNPSHIEANIMLGNIYKHHSKFNEALNLYRTVTTTQNSNIEARENLIDIYISINQTERALFHLTRIKHHAPNSDIIPWAEGIIEFKNNNYKLAVNLLQKTNYDSYTKNLFLGKANLALKNLKDALFHFNEATKIEKNNIEPKAHIAILYFLKNNFNNALPIINKILSTEDNTFGELLYAGAEIEFHNNNHLRARALANEALNSKLTLEIPDFSTTFPSKLNYLLGKICFNNTEYNEAQKFLKSIKNPILEENFQEINDLLAQSFFNLNSKKQALIHWEKILNKYPKNSKALFGIAKIFSSQNNFTSSIEMATLAFKSASEAGLKEEILVFKGNEYLKEKNINEALTSFKAALEISPKNINTYIKLAETYYLKKDHKNSILILEEALKIERSNVIVLYLMGKCFNEIGNHNKAISYFEEILSNDPNNINAYFSIIEILLNIEKKDLASKYYNHVLKIIGKLNPDKTQLIELEKYKKTFLLNQ